MILNRYLVNNVFSYTLGLSSIFLLIIVSSRSIQYFEQVAKGEIPAEIVFLVILYRTPEFLELILPLSFFTAVILCLGKFSSTNELTVFKQNGFTENRLVILLFLPALFITSLTFLIAFWITPNLEEKADHLLDSRSSIDIFYSYKPKEFYGINENLYLYAKEKDNNQLKSIFISDKSNHEEEVILFSKSLEILEEKKLFKLRDGIQLTTSSDNVLEELRFKEATFPIHSPQNLTSDLVALESIYLKELDRKVSISILPLLTLLIAVSFSQLSQRQGRYSRLVPLLIFYLLYLSLILFFAAQSDTNLSSFFLLLISHLFVILFSFLLFIKRRHS
tara:strand:- start:98559 stop:99560 length:1002 start_codon:yes stop_codon:yes gene_type:complete